MAKRPRGLQREIESARASKLAAVKAKRPAAELEVASLRAQLEAETLQHARNLRILSYWLLRAYTATKREGWEDGPTEGETWVRVIDVLACIGVDPDTAPARYLLKHPPANLHPSRDVDARREHFPDPEVG